MADGPGGEGQPVPQYRPTEGKLTVGIGAVKHNIGRDIDPAEHAAREQARRTIHTVEPRPTSEVAVVAEVPHNIITSAFSQREYAERKWDAFEAYLASGKQYGSLSLDLVRVFGIAAEQWRIQELRDRVNALQSAQTGERRRAAVGRGVDVLGRQVRLEQSDVDRNTQLLLLAANHRLFNPVQPGDPPENIDEVIDRLRPYHPRNTVDTPAEVASDLREALQRVDNNPNLVDQLRRELDLDAQVGSALVQRLSSELGVSLLTAPFEERRNGVIPPTREMQRFFKEEILMPALQEALENRNTPGGSSELRAQRRVELTARLKEFFNSAEFARWKEQNNLDLTDFTHATDALEVMCDIAELCQDEVTATRTAAQVAEDKLREVDLEFAFGSVQSGEPDDILRETVREEHLAPHISRDAVYEQFRRRARTGEDSTSLQAYQDVLRQVTLLNQLVNTMTLRGRTDESGATYAPEPPEPGASRARRLRRRIAGSVPVPLATRRYDVQSTLVREDSTRGARTLAEERLLGIRGKRERIERTAMPQASAEDTIDRLIRDIDGIRSTNNDVRINAMPRALGILMEVDARSNLEASQGIGLYRTSAENNLQVQRTEIRRLAQQLRLELSQGARALTQQELRDTIVDTVFSTLDSQGMSPQQRDRIVSGFLRTRDNNNPTVTQQIDIVISRLSQMRQRNLLTGELYLQGDPTLQIRAQLRAPLNPDQQRRALRGMEENESALVEGALGINQINEERAIRQQQRRARRQRRLNSALAATYSPPLRRGYEEERPNLRDVSLLEGLRGLRVAPDAPLNPPPRERRNYRGAVTAIGRPFAAATRAIRERDERRARQIADGEREVPIRSGDPAAAAPENFFDERHVQGSPYYSAGSDMARLLQEVQPPADSQPAQYDENVTGFGVPWRPDEEGEGTEQQGQQPQVRPQAERRATPRRMPRTTVRGGTAPPMQRRDAPSGSGISGVDRGYLLPEDIQAIIDDAEEEGTEEVQEREAAIARAIEAAFPEGPVRREYIRLLTQGIGNRDADEAYTVDGDGRDAEVVITVNGTETERTELVDFLVELQPVMDDRDTPRGVDSMLQDVYCNPIREQVPNYYVEQAPTTDQFQITDENADDYIPESQLRFFLSSLTGRYANPEVVPFVYEDPSTNPLEISVNPRLRTAERATNGDSGLFAQIAASAPNPEQQAILYRTAATAILALHERNRLSEGAPGLVSDWLDAQDNDPNDANTSLHAFVLFDHQNGDMTAPLRPADEQLLGYDASGDYSPLETLDLWEGRISELQSILANDNPQLSPNHVRWIEFLSHSVNTDLLLRNIRTASPEPPTPPEPPESTGPMARARRFARELISPEEPWTEVLENRIVPEEGVSSQEHIAPPTSIVRTVGEGHYRQRTVAPEDVQLEATVRFNRNSVQGVTDAFIGLFESESDSVPVFDERIMRRLSIRTAQRELQRSIVQNPTYQDTQAAVAYIRNAHRGKHTGANILSVAIRGDDMRVLLNRDGAAMELVSGAEVPLGRNDHHVLVLNDALRRALPNYQDIINIAQRVDLTTSEEISAAIINAAVARGGNPQDMSVLVSDFKALQNGSILDETVSPDGRPLDEHSVGEPDGTRWPAAPEDERVPRVRILPPLPNGPTTDILNGVLATDSADHLPEETIHEIIDHFRGTDRGGEDIASEEVAMVTAIIDQVPPGQRREDYLQIFINGAAGLARDNIAYSLDQDTGRVTYQIPGQGEIEVPLLEFIVWLQPLIEGENTPYRLFNQIQGRPAPEIAYYIPDPFVDFDIPHPDIYVAAPYPFFQQGDNGVWRENPAVAPFYYENPLAEDLERTSNLRFRTALQATNGVMTARGSGLFALAASSVLLEEESIPRNMEGQAAYYRTLVNSILKVHNDSTYNVLSDWLVEQGSNEAPPPGYEYPDDLSISHFIELDHVDGDLTQPRDENERLLAYIKSEGMGSDGNRSIYDHRETVRMWSDRIDVLNDLMAQDPADIRLLPHHIRWIEFLSHSVDITALVGDIGEEGSPPALPSPLSRATGWARRQGEWDVEDEWDGEDWEDVHSGDSIGGSEPAETVQSERGFRAALRRARARVSGHSGNRERDEQQVGTQEPQRDIAEESDLHIDGVKFSLRMNGGVGEVEGSPDGIFGAVGSYHHEGTRYRKSQPKIAHLSRTDSDPSLFFGVTESASYGNDLRMYIRDLTRTFEENPQSGVARAIHEALNTNRPYEGEQGFGFVVERNGTLTIAIDNVPNKFAVSVIMDNNGQQTTWGNENGVFNVNAPQRVGRAIIANQAVLDRVGGAQAAVDFINNFVINSNQQMTPGQLSQALVRHAVNRGGEADEMSVVIANVGGSSADTGIGVKGSVPSVPETPAPAVQLDGLPADVRAQYGRGGREQHQEQGRISAQENTWDVPENSVLGTVVYGQNEVNTSIRSRQIIQNHTQQGGPPSLLLGVSEGTESEIINAPLLGSDLILPLQESTDSPAEILRHTIIESRRSPRPQEATFVLEREGSVYVVNTSRHTEDAPYVVIDRQTDEGHSVAQVLRERNTVTEIPRVEEVNRIFIGNRAFWEHFPPGMAARRAEELAEAGRTPEQIAEALLREAVRFDGRAAHMTLVITTPRREDVPEPGSEPKVAIVDESVAQEARRIEVARRGEAHEYAAPAGSILDTVGEDRHEGTLEDDGKLMTDVVHQFSVSGDESITFLGITDDPAGLTTASEFIQRPDERDTEHLVNGSEPLVDWIAAQPDIESAMLAAIVNNTEFEFYEHDTLIAASVIRGNRITTANRGGLKVVLNRSGIPVELTPTAGSVGSETLTDRDQDIIHGNSIFWRHVTSEQAVRTLERPDLRTSQSKTEALMALALAAGGDIDAISVSVSGLKKPEDRPGEKKGPESGSGAETQKGRVRSGEISTYDESMFGSIVFGRHDVNTAIQSDNSSETVPERDGSLSLLIGVSEGDRAEIESAFDPYALQWALEASPNEPERALRSTVIDSRQSGQAGSSYIFERNVGGERQLFVVNQSTNAENAPMVVVDNLESDGRSHTVRRYDGSNVVTTVRDVEGVHRLFIGNRRFWQHMNSVEVAKRANDLAAAGSTSEQIAQILIQDAVARGGSADHMTLVIATRGQQASEDSGGGADWHEAHRQAAEANQREGGDYLDTPEDNPLDDVGYYYSRRGRGRVSISTAVEANLRGETPSALLTLYQGSNQDVDFLTSRLSTIAQTIRSASDTAESMREQFISLPVRVGGPFPGVTAVYTTNNTLYISDTNSDSSTLSVLLDRDGTAAEYSVTGNDIREIPLESTDNRVILATPNVWGYIRDRQAALDSIRGIRDPRLASREIVDMAVANGANEEDLSVVIANLRQEKVKVNKPPTESMPGNESDLTIRSGETVTESGGVRIVETPIGEGRFSMLSLGEHAGNATQSDHDSIIYRNGDLFLGVAQVTENSILSPYVNQLYDKRRQLSNRDPGDVLSEIIAESSGNGQESVAFVVGETAYLGRKNGGMFPLVYRDEGFYVAPDNGQSVMQVGLQPSDWLLVDHQRFRELVPVSMMETILRDPNIRTAADATRALVEAAIAAGGEGDELNIYVLEPRQKRKQPNPGGEPPPGEPDREVEPVPGGPEVHAPMPHGSLEINREGNEDSEAITPPPSSGLTDVGYVRERGTLRKEEKAKPEHKNTPLVVQHPSLENAPLLLSVFEQSGAQGEAILPLNIMVNNFGVLESASDDRISEVLRQGAGNILGPAEHVNASLAIVKNSRLYALNKSGQNIVVVDTDGQVERLPEESMQVQERALDTLGMVIVGNPAFMDRIGDLQGAVDFIRSNGWDSVMAGRHLIEIAVANGGSENDMSVVVANVGEQKANEAAGPAAEVFEAQEPISLQEAQEREIHTRDGILDGNLTGYALSRFSGQGTEVIADSDDRRNQTEAVFLIVESNATTSRPDYLNILQSELRTHQDIIINECIRRAVIEKTPNHGSDRLSLAYVDGMTLYAASRDGNFPIVDRNGRVEPLPEGDPTVRQMELQVGDRVIIPTPHFRDLVSDEDAVARIRGINNYNEASRTLVAMALDAARAQGRSVQDDIRVYVTSAAQLLGDERDTIRRDPTAPADAAESVPVTSTLEPARELTLEEAEALRIGTRGAIIERGNFVNYARGEHTRIPGNDSHTDARVLAFHGGEEMIFIVSDEYQGNRPMENYSQMFADVVYEREGVDISDAIRSTILEKRPFGYDERLSVAYLDGTTLYLASRDDAFPVVDRNGQIVPTTEAGPQVRRVELEPSDRLIVTNPRFRDFVPLDVAVARIKDIKDPIRATRALLNLAVEAGAQEDDLKVFITSTGRERSDAAVVPSTTSATLGAELELAAGEASAVQEPVSNEEAISLGINTTNYLLEDGNFRSYARSSFRGSDTERFATPRATDFNDGRELLMFVSEGDNETPLPQYREMLSRELGTGSNPDFRAAIREAILERPPSRGSENLSLAFTVGMTLYAVSRDDNFPLVDRGGHIVPLPPPTPGDDERIRQMQLQVGDRVIVRNARSRELVPDAVALARIRGIDSPHAAARTLVAMGVEAGEQEANISVYVTSPAQLSTTGRPVEDGPSIWQRLQAGWQAREGEHPQGADGRPPLRPSSRPSAAADVSGVPGETLSAQQASAAESDTQSAIAEERAQVEEDIYYLPAEPGEEPRVYAERLRNEYLEGADLVPGEAEIIDAIAALYPDPADEFSRNEFVRLFTLGLDREAWSGHRPEPPLRIEDGEVVYRILEGWRTGQERRKPVDEYVLGLHPEIEDGTDTISLFNELLCLPDPQRVIHNIPENLSLVGRPQRELMPMYTYTDDDRWIFNPTVNRYTRDVDAVPARMRRDARFLLAFNETGSTLLGWAAATGEVPSEQMRLYEAVAAAVVEVHQQNPELLRNWLRVQAAVVQTQAPDIPHTAIDLIQQDDHYEGTSGLKREAERMLGYTDRAYDEDRTVEIWTDRIRMLPTALSLQPLQLTANEIAYFDFLSQSADVDSMVEEIIVRAQRNTPPSDGGGDPDGTPPGGPEGGPVTETGEGEIELITNTEEAPVGSGLHTVSTSQYFGGSSVVVNRPEVRFNLGPGGDSSETMLQVYQYNSVTGRGEILDYTTVLPKGEVTPEAIKAALEGRPDTAQEAIAYIQSSLRSGEEEVSLYAINRNIDGPAVIVVGEDGQMAELSSQDMDVQGRRLFPTDRIIVASSEVIARVGLQQAATIVAEAGSTEAASAALARAAVTGMNGRSEYQNSFSVLVADLPQPERAADEGTQVSTTEADRAKLATTVKARVMAGLSPLPGSAGDSETQLESTGAIGAGEAALREEERVESDPEGVVTTEFFVEQGIVERVTLGDHEGSEGVGTKREEYIPGSGNIFMAVYERPPGSNLFDPYHLSEINYSLGKDLNHNPGAVIREVLDRAEGSPGWRESMAYVKDSTAYLLTKGNGSAFPLVERNGQVAPPSVVEPGRVEVPLEPTDRIIVANPRFWNLVPVEAVLSLINAEGIENSTQATRALVQAAIDAGGSGDDLTVYVTEPRQKREKQAEPARTAGESTQLEAVAAGAPGPRPETPESAEEGERLVPRGIEYQASTEVGVARSKNQDAYFTPEGMYLPFENQLSSTNLNEPLTEGQQRAYAQALADSLRRFGQNVYYPQRRGGFEVTYFTADRILEAQGRIRDLIAEGELQGFSIVADGMGGPAAGEVASSITTLGVADYIGRNWTRETDREELLRKAIDYANGLLRTMMLRNPALEGMGTTILTTVTDKNGETFGATLGDSHVYKRNRADNTAVQLTTDHSLVANLVLEGRIELSELLTNQQRSLLLSAVDGRDGSLSRSVRTFRTTLETDEKKGLDEQLIMVSDGVWEGVDRDNSSVTERLAEIQNTYTSNLRRMTPERALQIAFGEMFISFNVNTQVGWDFLPPTAAEEADLAKHLTRLRIQQLSNDNTTALIYTPKKNGQPEEKATEALPESRTADTVPVAVAGAPELVEQRAKVTAPETTAIYPYIVPEDGEDLNVYAERVRGDREMIDGEQLAINFIQTIIPERDQYEYVRLLTQAIEQRHIPELDANGLRPAYTINGRPLAEFIIDLQPELEGTDFVDRLRGIIAQPNPDRPGFVNEMPAHYPPIDNPEDYIVESISSYYVAQRGPDGAIRWDTNSDTHPFVTYENPDRDMSPQSYNFDLRFWSTLRRGEGGSVFALAAASALTPEDQVRLYRMVAEGIIDIYEQSRRNEGPDNPSLMRRLVLSQGEPSNPTSSINRFVQPTPYSEDGMVDLWEGRLSRIASDLAAGIYLSRSQHEFIDLFASGVNVSRLLNHIAHPQGEGSLSGGSAGGPGGGDAGSSVDGGAGFDWSARSDSLGSPEGGPGGPGDPDRGPTVRELLELNVGSDFTESTAHAEAWNRLDSVTEASYNPEDRTVDSRTFTELDVNDSNNVSFLSVYESEKQEQAHKSDYDPYPWLPTGYRADFNDLLLDVGTNDIPDVLTRAVINNSERPGAQGSVVVIDSDRKTIYAINKNVQGHKNRDNAVVVVNRGGHALVSSGEPNEIDAFDITPADTHLIMATPEFWKRVNPTRAVDIISDPSITTQQATALLMNEALRGEGGREAVSVIVTTLKEPEEKTKISPAVEEERGKPPPPGAGAAAIARTFGEAGEVVEGAVPAGQDVVEATAEGQRNPQRMSSEERRAIMEGPIEDRRANATRYLERIHVRPRADARIDPLALAINIDNENIRIVPVTDSFSASQRILSDVLSQQHEGRDPALDAPIWAAWRGLFDLLSESIDVDGENFLVLQEPAARRLVALDITSQDPNALTIDVINTTPLPRYINRLLEYFSAEETLSGEIVEATAEERPRVRRMTAAERETILHGPLNRAGRAALGYLNEHGIVETSETEGPIMRENRDEHAVLVSLNVENRNVRIVGKKDDPGEQLDDIERVLTAVLPAGMDPGSRTLIISVWLALNEHVNDGFRVNNGANTLRLAEGPAQALVELMFSRNSKDHRVAELGRSIFNGGVTWENSERFFHHIFTIVDTPEPAVTVIPAQLPPDRRPAPPVRRESRRPVTPPLATSAMDGELSDPLDDEPRRPGEPIVLKRSWRLLEDLGNELADSTDRGRITERALVAPSVLAKFLENPKHTAAIFPPGTEVFPPLTLAIKDGMLQLAANFSFIVSDRVPRIGGKPVTVRLADARLTVNPRGEIELVKMKGNPAFKLEGIPRGLGFIADRIAKDEIGKIDARLKKALSAQLLYEWEVSGFDLGRDDISVFFKREEPRGGDSKKKSGDGGW